MGIGVVDVAMGGSKYERIMILTRSKETETRKDVEEEDGEGEEEYLWRRRGLEYKGRRKNTEAAQPRWRGLGRENIARMAAGASQPRHAHRCSLRQPRPPPPRLRPPPPFLAYFTVSMSATDASLSITSRLCVPERLHLRPAPHAHMALRVSFRRVSRPSAFGCSLIRQPHLPLYSNSSSRASIWRRCPRPDSPLPARRWTRPEVLSAETSLTAFFSPPTGPSFVSPQPQSRRL